MHLPEGFHPLFAVVSDFHLWTPAEEAYERFLWSHGERRGLPDRIWNWMVCVGANLNMARVLLKRLRCMSDALVSLGDHYSHVVNECGLGERRARVCALAVRFIFQQRRPWEQLVWVPSDHDLGVTHRISAATGVQRRLRELSARFEQSEEFQRRLRASQEDVPQYGDLLLEPSVRSRESLLTSMRLYERLLGPLWGERVTGPYVLVWVSDVLLTLLPEKRLESVLAQQVQEQAEFLRRTLRKKRRVILCAHDPRALAYIPSHVFRSWDFPRPVLTIAGHLHMPWLRRMLPHRLRKTFRLVICPSLTGNRLAAGGGLVVEARPDGTLGVLRYRLSSDTFTIVW